MEIVNRSADSANYPISKNPGEYRNMLLEAGFNAQIKTHDGNVRQATFKDVVKHFQNIRLNTLMNPSVKDFNTGKNLDLEQWQQEALKNFSNSESIESISYKTSKQMDLDGVFKNIKPHSAKLEEFALAMQSFKDFIYADPFNRKFAQIGKIQFKPEEALKKYERDMKNPLVNEEAALRSFYYKVHNDMFTIGT